MIIDHIGIVAKSLEQGIAHWEKVFGYRQMTEIVTNTRQRVRVVFLCKDDSTLIKLIEPTDEESPIYTFARKGGGLHHLCFKTADMTGELDRLKQLRLRVIAEPQPGEAFDNEDIAFVWAKQGLNIELIETDKKAGLLPEPDQD